VRIVEKVIVPQGRRLYIEETATGVVEKRIVDGSTVTYFLDKYDSKLLYSSFSVLDNSNQDQLFVFDMLNNSSSNFLKLNIPNIIISSAIFKPETKTLFVLYDLDGLNRLRVLNGKTGDTINDIKVDAFAHFIDANTSNILLSNAYRNIFISSSLTMSHPQHFSIFSLGLDLEDINLLDVQGFNAIFKPDDPNIIAAIDRDKRLFTYDISNKIKKTYSIKCRFIKWIEGTNSLLVVIPKFSPVVGEFADIGVYDLDQGKYTRVMGGYVSVYKAFYE